MIRALQQPDLGDEGKMMRSGLNMLNLGLMAVLLVAAMSVHARGMTPTHDVQTDIVLPTIFNQYHIWD